MAVGQTIHPQRRVKRAANKAKNEELRAKNQHPKQLRNAANQMFHITKEHHGGLDRAERRRRGENLRTVVKRDKRIKKKFKALQLSAKKTEDAFVQMSESFRVLEGLNLDDLRH